ncbi:alpha/beta hydrolase family protein [Microbulbifer pacificus]|uniref:Alpha/beta fold hydrolase n=1 Tax=Microbulbifer pacificus TaxID=407164 RepID=A0AAU0N2J4_9GAMM|nr:alpha/beta fold hydrolase [Microbulbifer pacificus]WOX07192.1 alpha/beta fold hydrolase [Microbulbifer pacificus]
MQYPQWIKKLKNSMVSVMMALLPFTAHAAGLEGNWAGNLKVSAAAELPLVIHLQQNAGKWQGSMDSPAQGAFAIPMTNVEVVGQQLSFEISGLQAKYRGTHDSSTDSIRGTFTQGMSFELIFSRQNPADNNASVPVRPQMPVAPFSYKTEEVEVHNAKADIILAGTLTKPSGPIKATAVLISGSGPQDRDESIVGHKPFAVLADHLSQKGYAVLRLDDRGVGKSSGVFDNATSEDFAGDINAAVDFLKGRADIPANTIGLIGHSEGGMIAPMVASSRPDIAFVILMAAPGVEVIDLFIEQRSNVFRMMGVPPLNLSKIRQLDEVLFQDLNRLPNGANLTPTMRDTMREISRAMSEKDESAVENQVAAQEKILTSPWFRYFLKFDPETYLKKLEMPVLALNGSLDIQVAAKQNLDGIRQALEDGGNGDVQVVELDKLNHLFQTAETGAVSEYGNIEETIAPKALNLINEWLDKHFAQPGLRK